VARALRLSFSAHAELDARSLATFLDAAAEVKTCDLGRLDEVEQLTFFLNAYHLMVTLTLALALALTLALALSLTLAGSPAS